MKQVIIASTLLLLIVLWISSCQSGYKKQNGQWAWVTYDESAGKRVKWMEGIDNSSFRVLKNDNFGADNFSVFYQGIKIKQANPNGFVTLTDNTFGYAKDAQHVFLDIEVILKADPKSFEVLEFPYSRDKNDIYNGTLPMGLDKKEVEEFTVTNEDKMMAGSKTTSLLDYFIEYKPEYAWIKEYSPDTKFVIVGSSGTATTKSRKFKGLKELE